jgi:two-component system, OmpR family, response regulator
MHTATSQEHATDTFPTGAPERRRFLVADDDPDARALVVHALRADGAHVVEASGGLELLEWGELVAWGQKRERFDAIVSDILMPDCSALDVLARIPTLAHKAPVILMTAFNDELTRTKAYDLGAALVLNKPLHPTDLLALVRAVVRRSTVS